MLGFVKSEKRRTLGGEIVKEKRRRMSILFIVLGVLAFVALNLILYYMTKV